MQIRIHRIRGSNAMTYGDFDFIVDQERVYQLIGKNGSGKSSLPVILEEILFNKNSREVPKADIPHKFSGVKGWWGEVTLYVGEDLYIIHKDVKSTAKVKITKNGEDISGHTATQSYAIISELLGGIDFKTFSKLVYQSMDSSLDFLTATDANRKKFLVSLLGLEHYSEIEVKVKEAHKEIKKDLDTITTKHNQVAAWLKKSSTVPDEIELCPVPEPDTEGQQLLEEEQRKLGAAEANNQNIQSVQKAVEAAKRSSDRVENLHQELDDMIKNTPAPAEDKTKSIKNVTGELADVNSKMNTQKSLYKKFKAEATNTSCPTCGTALDVTQQEVARDNAEAEIKRLRPLREELQVTLDELNADQELYTAFKEHLRSVANKEKQLEQEVERSQELQVDDSELADKCKTDTISLKENISKLRSNIRERQILIDKTIASNTDAKVANAARSEQIENIKKYTGELRELQSELDELSAKATLISVLAEAFSPKGILSYKIESSIKVFEDLINQYLSHFMSG